MTFFRIIIILFFFFFLNGCSPTKPQILGSNYVWINYESTIKDIQVNNLNIKEVRLRDDKCNNKFRHVLELNGIINYDSSYIVEEILKQINQNNKCYYGETPIVTDITLNSEGGLLADGYRMGEIFKEQGVHARITNNQVCMSSCSMAFLGAKFRSMEGNSKLMVHSPYRITDSYTIECISNKEANDLKNYYIKMIGSESGNTLFDRTMRYCNASDGWTINSDAAKVFKITTN